MMGHVSDAFRMKPMDVFTRTHEGRLDLNLAASWGLTDWRCSLDSKHSTNYCHALQRGCRLMQNLVRQRRGIIAIRINICASEQTLY